MLAVFGGAGIESNGTKGAEAVGAIEIVLTVTVSELR